MNTQVGFILKVVLLSIGLSFLIKYGGIFLPIAPKPIYALVAIFLPFLMLAIALGWRFQRQQQIDR
jgi:membrane protein implicated in regulation of membrane protease activity